jgi:hypothetical protein
MSTTLFSIDQNLARLYEEREEEMALVVFGEPAEEQRRDQVRAIDLAISDHLKSLDRKVDGIAYLCKELVSRAAVHKFEGKRLIALAAHEEATAAEIRSRAAEVLSQRVAPEVIAAATQGSNLLKLTGQQNTISLRKSPPAVVIGDQSLLPRDLLMITIKIPAHTWDAVIDVQSNLRHPALYALIEAAMTSDCEPVKAAIAARLRERMPCEACGATGTIIETPAGAGHEDDLEEHVPCPECGGNGTVQASVPGARLIEDNVYLVIK